VVERFVHIEDVRSSDLLSPTISPSAYEKPAKNLEDKVVLVFGTRFHGFSRFTRYGPDYKLVRCSVNWPLPHSFQGFDRKHMESSNNCSNLCAFGGFLAIFFR
jgi:hypothetical protein